MAAERAAVNMPIQGTAADIMKLAMIDVDRALAEKGFVTEMVLQVHDELVFEAPEGEVERVVAIVRAAMEHPYELSVPLVVNVGVGGSWAEAH